MVFEPFQNAALQAAHCPSAIPSEIVENAENCKDILVSRLQTVIENNFQNSDPGLEAKHRHALRVLHRALVEPESSAKVSFEFEHVMPVHSRHLGNYFREALIRLKAGDENIEPAVLFPAIEKTGFGRELGRNFRQWLIPAQFIDFYGIRSKTEKVSFNIMPYDVDSEDFQETLGLVMKTAGRAGFKDVILELTEYGRWTGPKVHRAEFMRGLNAKLAIDDYGDPAGFHDQETIKLLADGELIVKLDGKLVSEYDKYLLDSAKGSDALVDHLTFLKEIVEKHPEVKIALEWLGADEQKTDRISSALLKHNLYDVVHLLQDNGFRESTFPATFAARREVWFANATASQAKTAFPAVPTPVRFYQ